jgi:thioredoxin reductase/Pyruvate/2-oxoacid:ferredoxin oxidoreductase delta subunit
MEGVLTTLGFLLVTAIFVVVHQRGRRRSTPPPAETACPRCGKPLAAGLRRCPHCGVPLQIFELIQVGEAASARREAAPGVRPHAVVRADVCVGCGTCADACPVPGAIVLQGKLAVVDRALCEGHAECVKACPVGAIAVGSGEAVQRVRVPDLAGSFESNVPGLYVVGELGGRGLIKNAVNEGKIAAEHAARALARATQPPGAEVLDLAVVGSGPAGLSAGLEALRCGLRYAVLEQGTLADSIRKYPRHKLLLAEPVRIPLYGDLWVADASKESLLEVWDAVIAATGLQVRTGCRVETVVRAGDRFRIHTTQGMVEARRVILAMGRRGTPRRLGVPGEERDSVFYDIMEMETFRGRRVLVVGGGDSAVESALGLANQPGTVVHLSYRQSTFERVKERNRAKLAAAVSAGRLQLILGSRVVELREGAAVLEHEGRRFTLPADDVIVRIGGDPPFAFLEKVGIRLVDKDVPLAGMETAHAG